MKGWSVKWLKESIAYTEVRIRKAFSCRRTPATILQRKKAGTLLARSRRSACPAIKVSADDLIKLQRIRKAAEQGEFDILLLFMYDRLGRNLNETPFIAEWFTKKGIHVWSVYEGEIIDGVDAERMLDYIRFWQTDEAQKL